MLKTSVKDENSWKPAIAWIKVNGEWVQVCSSSKNNGAWDSVCNPTYYPKLELYSPGTDSVKSSRFTVEVSSQLDSEYGYGYRSAYVFSRARPAIAAYGLQFTGPYDAVTNPYTTRLWRKNSSPECSFLTFGVEGNVKAKVSHTVSSISSAKLRPASKNWNYQITGGNLIIDMEPMDKVWVEVNNETSSPLFIFCDPPKPPLPSTHRKLYFPPGINYVSSIPGPHQTVTYSGVTGTFPTTSVYYETFHGINFSSIPNYEEGKDYYIYLDGGAYVIGSFNLRNRNNIKFIGPGILSLENMPKERMGQFEAPGLEFNNPYSYTAVKNSGAVPILLNDSYEEIRGTQNTSIEGNPYTYDGQPSGCILSGITIIDTPFWGPRGFNGVDNLKIISPWSYNTDGVDTIADRKTRFHYNRDSFFFVADDCIYSPYNMKSFSENYPLQGGSSVYSGLTLYSQNNGPIALSYTPRFYANQQDKSYSALIHDLDIGLYSYNRQGVETPIRLTQNYNVTAGADPANYGIYDMTLSNVRIEEPIDGALFWVGNIIDPFAYALGIGQTYPFGAISGITIANISAISSPTNPGSTPAVGQYGISSMPIYGFDASSRPYNITFKNIMINGEYITDANRDNFIDWVSGTAPTWTDPDSYPSNIVFVTGT
jgi:hypothetical protein